LPFRSYLKRRFTCNKVRIILAKAKALPEEPLGEGDEGHDGPVVEQGHTAQQPEHPGKSNTRMGMKKGTYRLACITSAKF
jgi:hypothetical protein